MYLTTEIESVDWTPASQETSEIYKLNSAGSETEEDLIELRIGNND